MIQFPNRKELMVITKDDLATMREKLFKFVITPLLSLVPFIIILPFLRSENQESSDSISDSDLMLIVIIFVIVGSLIIIAFTYLFIKWYNTVETFYNENERLLKETIFLGKVKNRSWIISEIHHVSIFQYVSTSSSSSRTSNYKILVNTHDSTDPNNKRDIIFTVDKKRKHLAYKLALNLESEGIQIKGKENVIIDYRKFKENNQTNLTKCGKCGELNNVGDTFCIECGNRL